MEPGLVDGELVPGFLLEGDLSLHQDVAPSIGIPTDLASVVLICLVNFPTY